MNTFAKVIKIEGFTGKAVNYYTVHIEERERNEFEDFIFRHILNTEIEVQLNYLNEILERFSRQGAREHYFRSEGSFHALPPPAKYIEVDFGREQLRLYCLFISKNIVFLFNGGIKTKDKAQDCENVKGYFQEANKITQRIDELIRDRQIEFDRGRTNILNYEGIELWLS